MTDDLEYLRARVSGYAGYAAEGSRNDSDMRVRAFAGEELSDADVRLKGSLDERTSAVLSDVLMRCMFADQVFVRKLEHARFDAPMLAALVRADRRLVELAENARTVSAQTFLALLVEIDKQFEYRRDPAPVPAA